jgi:hypothetical protein
MSLRLSETQCEQELEAARLAAKTSDIKASNTESLCLDLQAKCQSLGVPPLPWPTRGFVWSRNLLLYLFVQSCSVVC